MQYMQKGQFSLMKKVYMRTYRRGGLLLSKLAL